MTTRVSLRLGDLLVQRGILTHAQVRFLLLHQQTSHRPLGELAEALLGVSPRAVEEAWVQQYLALGVGVDLDHQPIDPALAAALTRRQAWQFELLPLYRCGGELTVATTARRLPRAVAFAWSHFGEPVRIVVADDDQLHLHLLKAYPWAVARKLDPRGILRTAAQHQAAAEKPTPAAAAVAAPAPPRLALATANEAKGVHP